MRAGGAACTAATAANVASALITSEKELCMLSLHRDDAVAHRECVIEKPARRAWIDDVLLAQHARRERAGVVAGAHRQRRLDHDRAAVEFGGDEVHGAAVQLH